MKLQRKNITRKIIIFIFIILLINIIFFAIPTYILKKKKVDITETETIEPNDFVDSILYLNEAKLFRDAVDFFYEFKNDRLILEVGMKNPYMDEKYIAECSIKDEVSNKDVEEKLRETIFSKAERETM